MLYEFREKKPTKKHKSNKREKKKNKKINTKNKIKKQKHLTNKKLIKEKTKEKTKGNDMTTSWEDIILDKNKENNEATITTGKGRIFNILDKEKEIILKANIDEELPAHLRNTLIVWDIVFYQKEEEWKYIIKKRKKRKNYLSRTKSNTSRFWAQQEQIIAANIDVAVIVSPIKEPDFDHKLIDRYLILCQNRWVTPIICLNKIDLRTKKEKQLDNYIKTWIQVIETSTTQKKGIKELKKLLTKKTAIVLWKSWVWKSSLVNTLYTNTKLTTQEINKKSWEGKHTTTSSNLYKREKGSYIIDTPWIRALWVDQIKKENLKNYFPEFIKYKGQCKYNKCLHEIEPDCAIKQAVKNKKISKERYKSYIRILNDLI